MPGFGIIFCMISWRVSIGAKLYCTLAWKVAVEIVAQAGNQYMGDCGDIGAKTSKTTVSFLYVMVIVFRFG